MTGRAEQASRLRRRGKASAAKVVSHGVAGGGGVQAARRADPLPGAGPRQPVPQAGQGAARALLPRHLRPHRVQPRPPPPLAGRRRRRRRRRPPLRDHPRRPPAADAAGAGRDAGHLGDLRGHAADGARARQGAGREARPPRRPAGELRRGRRRHGVRGARRQGDGHPGLPLLHAQRLRPLGLPQLRSARQAWLRATQRRELPHQRVPGHPPGLGRRHDRRRPPPRPPDVHPHHRPRRRDAHHHHQAVRARRARRRRHPAQHLRRPGARRARRHPRAPPEHHHRGAHRPGGLAAVVPPFPHLQPVEGGRPVRGVAGRPRRRRRGVRQLREHHGDDEGAGRGVRARARRRRHPVPVGHTAGHGARRRRAAAAAGGVRGGGGGERAGADGGVVRPGGGAGAPRDGSVPEPLRVELDGGEPRRRRADVVLAVLLGAGDQLPVRVRGVGGWGGDGARCGAARGGGRGEGGDGGRGEGGGGEEEGGGVEGEGRGGGGARRVVAAEPREVLRGDRGRRQAVNPV